MPDIVVEWMKWPKVVTVAPRVILRGGLELQRLSGYPAPTPKTGPLEMAPQPVSPPPAVAGVVTEASAARTAPPVPSDAEVGEIVPYAVTRPTPAQIISESAGARARGV